MKLNFHTYNCYDCTNKGEPLLQELQQREGMPEMEPGSQIHTNSKEGETPGLENVENTTQTNK